MLRPLVLLSVISRVRNQQQSEITNVLNLDYISHSGGRMKFSILSSTEGAGLLQKVVVKDHAH